MHKITVTLRVAHRLLDKLTILFELRQDRRIRSHFRYLIPYRSSCASPKILFMFTQY